MNFNTDSWMPMTFSKALEKVKEGYSMGRKDWCSIGRIKLVAFATGTPDEYRISIVKMFNANNTILEQPYVPSESDLLTDDWGVCMTPEEKEILQINKIVESAIYHGGDPGGPYFTASDSVYKSISEYLKLLKRDDQYIIDKDDGHIPRIVQFICTNTTTTKFVDEKLKIVDIEKELDNLIEEA